MIAIIGKIGVGKTTFLKNCGIELEQIFFADVFVAQNYEKNGLFYEPIKQKIGEFLIDENGVSKPKILAWLSQNTENILKLEKLIYPIIYEHLKSNEYKLAEMPVLVNKNVNFLPLISGVLCLSTSDEIRVKNLQKRNVDKATLKQLDKKNDTKKAIKSLFGKKLIVEMYGDNFESTDQNKKILSLLN
ncbi:dephospho-CoA kinase [Mycoplasma simbae]|uniref:dephospho-CoA kinase n=1 Tax=Mycoplasma simbae TaxID=36744 RepID=UPI000496AB29|nr:dephospho-CoA kinase [Mycoplasma simbae]